MRLARRPLLGILTYASLVLALSTCDLSKVLSTPKPRKVVLSFPADSTLIMGSGIKPTLQVTIDGDPIIDPEIAFVSSDTSVVAISPRGDSLIARKLGAATITASLQGTLLPDPRPSASDTIYVVPKELTIAPSAVVFSSIGDSATLTAVAIDANNQVIPNIPVTWQSSDPAAVSVSALGVLVARNNTTGPTTVSARLAGITVTAPVTVAQQLDHFVFTPARQTLDAIGATVTVTAGGRDRRGNEMTGLTGLEWQSGNGGVLSVTSAGVVTALDNGLSFVRVSRGPVSDTVDIDVDQQAANVDIVASAGTEIRAVGGTLRLLARSFDRRDIEVRQKKASWISLDGNVARVDTTGVVEGLGTGTARIVARVDAVAETLTVTVSDDPSEIQVNPPAASLTSVGAVLQLSAAVRNALGAPIPGAAVSWRTPDPLVASVSATGQVQALGVGIARIIASSGATADTANVTISNLPDQVNILIEDAVLASVNDSLVPDVAVFNALGAPLPATSLQWSSEDPAVARVTTAGIIIATGVGSVWIKGANPVNLSRRDSVFVTVTNAPAAVLLSATSDVLTAVGRTRTYSGEVRNARGALIPGAEITWSSTDILVATVSGGFVTARGAGSALIIGSSGTKADTVSLTVTNAPVSLEITPSGASITTIGDELTSLTASVRNDLDEVIPGAPVAWRTPDVTLADVLANGTVRALAVGTARVIAQSGAASDTALVVITNVPDLIDIVPEELTLASVNDQVTPAATIENARQVALSRTSVLWSTDDPLVARVSLSGTITAAGAGTTFIKAVSPANALKRDSVEVTVTNAPNSVVLNAEVDVITAVGRTRTYFAEVRNTAGALLADYPVEFRSTATSVATVIPSTGVVTAMGVGGTFIIAQAGTKADTITLQVLNTPRSVELTPPVAEITSLNDVLGLQAIARNDLDEVIPSPDLSWRSVNETIATVNISGQVTGHAVGSTKIIVTAGTHADTTTLTVSNNPAEIDIIDASISLTSLEDSIAPAATIRNGLGVTLPRTAATWSSDDPSIARVSSSGMIVARDVGTTIIRATSGSVTDFIEVVVTNAPASLVLDLVRDTLTKTGQVLSYVATVRNAANAIIPNEIVTWTSTTPGVASVLPGPPPPPTGKATALGNGSTKIIASAGVGAAAKKDTADLVVVNATRIYVDNSSVATPRVGTIARPFATIQDGVNAADVTDVVIVKTGNTSYSETVNIAKNITVTGDSAAFVAAMPGLRDPELLPVLSHDTGSTGIIVGAAGATIKYLSLRHNLDGPAIDANNGNLTVDWFYVNHGATERQGRGISLRNPPSISSVKHSFVNAVRGYGVRVEGATNATLSKIVVGGVDSVPGTMGSGIEIVGGTGNRVDSSTIRGTKGAQIQVTSSASVRIRQNSLTGRHQLVRISGTNGITVDTNSFNLVLQSDDPDVYLSTSSSERSGLKISNSSNVAITGNTFDEGSSREMDAIHLVKRALLADTMVILRNQFVGGRYNVRSDTATWRLEGSRSEGAERVLVTSFADTAVLVDDTLTNAVSGCVQIRGLSVSFSADRVKFDNCATSAVFNGMYAIDAMAPGGTAIALQPALRIAQSSFRGANQTAVSLVNGKRLLMTEDTLIGTGGAPQVYTPLGAVNASPTDTVTLSNNTIKGYASVAGLSVNGSRMTLSNNRFTQNKFGLRSAGGWTVAPSFADNEIFDNDTAGVNNTSVTSLSVNDVWWGDERGSRRYTAASSGDTIMGAAPGTAPAFRLTPVNSGTVAAALLKARTPKGTSSSTLPITVRVVDVQGRPVSNVNVTFSCTAAPGVPCTTSGTSGGSVRRLLTSGTFVTTTFTSTSNGTKTVQTDQSGLAEILLQLNGNSGFTNIRAAVTSPSLTLIVVADGG